MPKILLVGDDSHIRESIMQLHVMNEPLEIIPIESAQVKNRLYDIETGLYPHVIEIQANEPINFEEFYPLPKKGIGQKAQWASKPHKRKRK
jgi:hypothetical protein